jgi:hypothetical protein
VFAFLDRRGWGRGVRGGGGSYYSREWDGRSYYERDAGYGPPDRGYFGRGGAPDFAQPRLPSGRDYYGGSELDGSPPGFYANERDGPFSPRGYFGDGGPFGRGYYGDGGPFGRGYYGSGRDGRPPRRSYADSEWSSLVGWEDLGDPVAADNDFVFVAKMARMSATLAYLAKYGHEIAPPPLKYAWEGGLNDGTVTTAALAFILVPTLINCAKWTARSKADADFYRNF